jgi:hypothetical protein
VHTEFWWENVRKINNFEDLSVDEKIINFQQIVWEDAE